MDYKGLLRFAETDLEKKYLAALVKKPNQTVAARTLKVARSTITSHLAIVRRRAIKRGWAPEYDMTHPSAPGFHVKKRNAHFKDGKIVEEWVTVEEDRLKTLENMREVIEAMAQPCKGAVSLIAAPKDRMKDLLAVYPVAEPHMGMYACSEETGDDYDLQIAKTALVGTMAALVHSAPNTEECLILNLADYFHADNSRNMTEASGNILDVDTRWGKVFLVGVEAYKELIKMALTKHKKVTVKSGIGNHDKHSIFALHVVLREVFSNNPRVTVELPFNAFSYYQWGKNLIGLHHGNGVKPNELLGIMAADKPKEWGESLYRVFFRGHIHHKDVKESAGGIVESFRSIASKDNWHSSAGYRALRAMECVIFKRSGGERGRRIEYV